MKAEIFHFEVGLRFLAAEFSVICFFRSLLHVNSNFLISLCISFKMVCGHDNEIQRLYVTLPRQGQRKWFHQTSLMLKHICWILLAHNSVDWMCITLLYLLRQTIIKTIICTLSEKNCKNTLSLPLRPYPQSRYFYILQLFDEVQYIPILMSLPLSGFK